jgi:phospholipid/cholesterol/gamma-HCH transport system substrate-binding protein
MKSMRERNQVAVAIVGTILIAAVLLIAVNLDKLPFFNPTNSYTAHFPNAEGLRTGDDVRVEGITVGSVDSIKVDGAQVDVGFSIKSDVQLGRDSRASIEVATVLGNLFMQIESAGPGTLPDGATLPEPGAVPYSLLEALNAFGKFSQKTQIGTLRKSLQTLSTTINSVAPSDVKTALNGLSDVATTIAAKQNDITEILQSANAVVSTLNHNSNALVSLLAQGDEFLKLVEQRHTVISQLLADTANLGRQLRKLIGKDGAQFAGLFSNLATVTAVLSKEKRALQNAVVNLGQFSVNIANATGSGPYLDLFSPTVLVPDNQLKACGPHPEDAGKKPCGVK